jgi:hypothetical protein
MLPPIPLQTPFLHVPGVSVGSAVPAGTSANPHIPSVHVAVMHALPDMGQSDGSTQGRPPEELDVADEELDVAPPVPAGPPVADEELDVAPPVPAGPPVADEELVAPPVPAGPPVADEELDVAPPVPAGPPVVDEELDVAPPAALVAELPPPPPLAGQPLQGP